MNSYAAEVHTCSCKPGVWTANALRWPLTPAGKTAAEEYGLDLACRWSAVTDFRVVESPSQPNREVPS